jgi:hypothetical protein
MTSSDSKANLTDTKGRLASSGYEPSGAPSYSLLSQFKVPPPIFDGTLTEYLSWRNKIMIYFQEVDLGSLMSASTEDEAFQVPEFGRKDQLLFKLLLFTTTGPVANRVRVAQCQGSGWRFWTRMEYEYNRQDVASQFEAFAQLMALRYRNGSLREYFDSYIASVELVISKGLELPEGIFVFALLFSLPAEFSTFKSLVLGQNIKTLDVVRTMALSEEAMLRRNEQEQVLFSQNRRLPQPPSSSGKRKFIKGNKKAKDKCRVCHKLGHWARECPERVSEIAALLVEAEPPAKKLKLQEPLPDAMECDEIVLVSCDATGATKVAQEAAAKKATAKPQVKPTVSKPPKLTEKVRKLITLKNPPIGRIKKVTKPVSDQQKIVASGKNADDTVVKDKVGLVTLGNEVNKAMSVDAYLMSFILDTGATSHMVSDSTILDNFQPDSRTIGQAEKGRRLESIGIGDLSCHLGSGNGIPGLRLKLCNVLVIPTLSMNIVSGRKLTESGLTMVFRADVCEVLNSVGKKLFTCEKINGLYWLKVRVRKDAVNLVNEEIPKLELWHRRLGHLGVKMVKQMLPDCNLQKVPLKCSVCLEGKLTRAPFTKSETKSTRCFDLIHSDVCGPFPVDALHGYRYFVTFIDDKSKFCFIYLIKWKSEVLEKFKEFLAMVQNVFEARPKILRSDNGGEYVSKDFKKVLSAYGILHQTTVPYTPQQNGVAERMNRTITETVKCLLFGARLPQQYWGYAVLCAVYVRNRCWTAQLDKKSPYEVLYGSAPGLEDLRIFGCICYVQVPNEKRNKLDARARKCVFLGYSTTSKAYLVQDAVSKRIFTSRDVIFFEGTFENHEEHKLPSPSRNVGGAVQMEPVFEARPVVPGSSNVLNQGEILERASPRNEEDISDDVWQPAVEDQDFLDASGETQTLPQTESMSSGGNMRHHQDAADGGEDLVNPQPYGEKDWMGSRYIMQNVDVPPAKDINAPPKHTKRVSLYRQGVIEDPDEMAMVTLKGPRTYYEAVSSSESSKWIEAMEEEMASIIKNETYELVEAPKGRKIVDCRWVLGIKQDADGNLARYKARLCARGFTQEYGIDYEETYSPVVQFNSIRVFLTIAVWLKMEVEQMDVITAFLNGVLQEEVYMRQPPGFEVEGKENRVCRLKKSLYGLKQSPRQWNKTMNEFLQTIGFVNCTADTCMYIKHKEGKTVMIALYVDDLIIASNCNKLMRETKQYLNKRFEMKDLGKLRFYLGIEVLWNKDGSCSLRQRPYIQEILEKFNMMDCKPVAAPISSGQKLTKAMCPETEEEIRRMSKVPYRSAVGSINWLVTGTRPDLAVAVGDAAKYLNNPGEQHWIAVKRIIRYLKETKDWSLVIKPTSLNLVGYCDADWAGDLDSRRSTTGYIFKLGGVSVCWKSKRQPTVALSTSEAEYMALSSAAQMAIWLRRLLSDLSFVQTKATVIFEDNQGCIAIAKNPVNHERTKHIDIKYHFVRELIEANEVAVTYLQTEDMLADILTKGLARDRHQKLCRAIGLH